MPFRKKIYYPESQIEKNLYTSGKEWMYLQTWQEYIGYYHRYTNGEVYTEREWDPNRSLALIKYKENPEPYFRYLDLKNYTIYNGEKYEIIGAQKYFSYIAPRAVKVIPSSSEIESGNMIRYFVFKRNEPNKVIFEVDKRQIEDFNKDNVGINQYLYNYFEMPWKLNGPEFDVFLNGILKTPGVVTTNQRIIDRFSKKFPILRQILNNPREHSIYDNP
jgi:hypothetical protein